ncbi:DUF1570 domain-containing protein [Pedobacter sp. BS3]|uniref:DUF1570 domain-containing protein n=1 Tax=Pedobacter sp. BS3 TaxID=2567937 RepID=UPI0011EBB3D7|nr:DUF1570 domain-containing protein [Pedobacter sp. BS3]TZF82739.1 DUF1570 domain-containing protein [Pedobacter sp. BS3]
MKLHTNVLLRSGVVLAIVCVMFITKLSAQQINFVEVGFKLSAKERQTLNRLIDYEIKVYNGMFNTWKNDSLPITINIYFKYKDFNQVRKTIGNYVPSDLGFYQPFTKQSYVFAGNNFMQTVIHEASHCLLHNNLLTVPHWMNEGIAEFFETLTIDGNQIYIVPQSGRIRYIKEQVRAGKIDLQRFFTNDQALWSDKKNFDYLYSTSYSIIHYIIKSNPDAMNKIISLMREKRYRADFAIASTFGGMDRFEQSYKFFYR